MLLALARDQKGGPHPDLDTAARRPVPGLRHRGAAGEPGAGRRLPGDGGVAGLPQVPPSPAGPRRRGRAQRRRDGRRPGLSAAAVGGHAGGRRAADGQEPAGPGRLRPRRARGLRARYHVDPRGLLLRVVGGLRQNSPPHRESVRYASIPPSSIPSKTPWAAFAACWVRRPTGRASGGSFPRPWGKACSPARRSPRPSPPASSWPARAGFACARAAPTAPSTSGRRAARGRTGGDRRAAPAPPGGDPVRRRRARSGAGAGGATCPPARTSQHSWPISGPNTRAAASIWSRRGTLGPSAPRPTSAAC